MNSTYGSDNLYENGWATENENNAQLASQSYSAFPSSSTYLTSLQLLHAADQSSPRLSVDIITAVPDHYRTIYEKYRSNLASVSELEANLFQPLLDSHLLTQHQLSRIVDTLYDHNLLPASVETNFFQILGLIALEVDVAGSGDFVTLQFKLNSGYPPLLAAAVSAILDGKPNLDEPLAATAELNDPLTSQLASASLDDPSAEENDWGASEGLLADHSALLIDPDTTIPELLHVNDYPYLNKYTAEIRDKFKPLVGQNNAIKIKEVPEKEGLLFKHINYAITHEIKLGMSGPGTKKVIRRYSDFAWLLEFLLKKYPFRVIPGLPPKKFSGM